MCLSDQLTALEAEAAANVMWMSALRPELAEEFQSVQDTWLQYRDADCGLAYDFVAPGTAAGIFEMQCLVDRTQERVEEILELCIPFESCERIGTPRAPDESAALSETRKASGTLIPTPLTERAAGSTGVGVVSDVRENVLTLTLPSSGGAFTGFASFDWTVTAADGSTSSQAGTIALTVSYFDGFDILGEGAESRMLLGTFTCPETRIRGFVVATLSPDQSTVHGFLISSGDPVAGIAAFSAEVV